ncbi:MAG: hypothetical protein GVY30_06320 [Chloroflexi bacterium]|jgi:hypothetical protein|nr:hypothetical protein [Chloroflexota bacterium]
MRAQGVIQGKQAASVVIPVELELSEANLIEAFRRLPSGRRAELLDKLQALREPLLRTVPANQLYGLTGLVSLGGDALADTEALYDDDCGY